MKKKEALIYSESSIENMTENIDAELIKKTQDTLGKFVKKPPLTEKLLRKPPFKFILDIVKAVSFFPLCV